MYQLALPSPRGDCFPLASQTRFAGERLLPSYPRSIELFHQPFGTQSPPPGERLHIEKLCKPLLLPRGVPHGHVAPGHDCNTQAGRTNHLEAAWGSLALLQACTPKYELSLGEAIAWWFEPTQKPANAWRLPSDFFLHVHSCNPTGFCRD